MNSIVSRKLWLSAVAVASLATCMAPIGLAQSRIANAEGSYFGLFANVGTGHITAANLPYLEQDNMLLAGELVNEELGSLGSFGTIHPNDKCNLISVDSGANSVYKATWSRLGGGTGALTGPISVNLQPQKVAGSLVLLRPFPVTGTKPPSLSGDYAGLGVTSAVYIKYDGIASPRDLNMELTVGRTTSNYSLVFDVNESGRIVGIGVQANGDILHVDGQILDGASKTLELSISVTTSTGIVLHTDSIIAILIG